MRIGQSQQSLALIDKAAGLREAIGADMKLLDGWRMRGALMDFAKAKISFQVARLTGSVREPAIGLEKGMHGLKLAYCETVGRSHSRHKELRSIADVRERLAGLSAITPPQVLDIESRRITALYSLSKLPDVSYSGLRKAGLTGDDVETQRGRLVTAYQDLAARATRPEARAFLTAMSEVASHSLGMLDARDGSIPSRHENAELAKRMEYLRERYVLRLMSEFDGELRSVMGRNIENRVGQWSYFREHFPKEYRTFLSAPDRGVEKYDVSGPLGGGERRSSA